MTNSRQKGKVGERDVCKGLATRFPDIRRTAQNQANGVVGDVEAPESLPHIHFEVKHGNRNDGKDLGMSCGGLASALDQACRDCPAGSFPVVIWRNTVSKTVRYPGVRTWKMTWVCPSWGHPVTVAGWDAIADTLERLEQQTGA